MSINTSVYDKFCKIIAEQQKKIQQQEEKLLRLKQRKERRAKREWEKTKRVKQLEREKREKAMELIHIREQRKFQQMRKRENQAQLKKETLKWEQEIRKEEKRQAKVLDGLKWRGKKKFGYIRRKLENKLKKIKKSGRNIRPTLISEVIGRNTSKWAINRDGFKDPVVFLENTTPAVERLIISTNSIGKKVHTILVCKMV